MRSTDVRRYKRLLEEKQLELFAKTEAEARVPRAETSVGDLIDQANAQAEAGIRAGELLGLQWKHVSIERRELRIEQSLWNKQVVEPKTKTSKDSIWFDDVLARVLAVHRQDSRYTGPEDFVFAKPDGSPLNPDVLRRDVLYPSLDRLRIPRPKGASGFHAFRHTAGSVVEEQTGRLKLAQRFLRHSNLSTTADIYTHTSRQAERDAATAGERWDLNSQLKC